MDNLSAEDLVRLCQQTLPDDTRPFEAIVGRYKKRIFATAYRLLGDRDDAEDQTQEIFLKIYRNIRSLNEPATFEAWIKRITVNTCLDALEKGKRRPVIKISLDSDEEAGELKVASNSNPAKDFENKEIRNCLEKALAKLEPNGRSAIVLRDVEEWAYEEIAETLKAGLSAVKMRIHRARLAVQKLIEEICPDSWRAANKNGV